jgi:hypothetical protein
MDGMNKALAIMVSASIAVFAGCAQSVGSDSAVEAVLAHPVIDTEKPNLCLIGDSRVAIFPVELFTDYDVFDYGVGGSDSGDNVDILSAIADTGIRFDAVIVSVGVNDWASNLSTMQSVKNIRSCLCIAYTISSRVFVTTIPGCCPNKAKTIDKVNAISNNALAINGYLPIVQSVTLIPLAETLSDRTSPLYINEIYDDGSGIHYNADGYDVIYTLYMQYLR